MSLTITYYASPSSPWTYLGHDRFIALAAKAGAAVDLIPFEASIVFPRTGGLPLPKRAPERQAYRMAELHRWRDFLGMPLNPEPAFFPVNSWPACRLMAATKADGGDVIGLTGRLLRAVWVEERNTADTDTLTAIAAEAGLDPAMLDKAATDEMEAAVTGFAEQAIAAGAFGPPCYVVNGEPFWGQDRLDLLVWRLGVT